MSKRCRATRKKPLCKLARHSLAVPVLVAVKLLHLLAVRGTHVNGSGKTKGVRVFMLYGFIFVCMCRKPAVLCVTLHSESCLRRPPCTL